MGYLIILESYVDDIFGGAGSKTLGTNLINQLISVGKLTTAVMNPLKCRGPAQILDILGLRYNAILRQVTIPDDKRMKYLGKIREVLSAFYVTSKDIVKLIGYLGYASWAEPFGRPFLSALGFI